MKRGTTNILLTSLVFLSPLALGLLAGPGSAQAKPPATEEMVQAGEKTYKRRCFFCHGEEGLGDGPVADYLDPRPRDFSIGMYKLRTTVSGALPTDEDLFRTVTRGIPGTAMPSWGPYLTEMERWQVVYYIKTFFPEFDLPELDPYEQVVEVSQQIPPSPESVAKGREIFEREKCWECHGKEVRGDGIKIHKLKDAWDFPIRPADLTRKWRIKGGADPKDLYLRFTTGLDGTPMPSFINTLSPEERWHLANFIASLHNISGPGGTTVLISKRVEGEVPLDPDAPVWQGAPPLHVPLMGQVIVHPRWQNHSVDLVTVRSVHNAKAIGFLLEWNDPTEDRVHQDIQVPLDPNDTYVKVADLPRKPGTFRDQLALQFPVKPSEGSVKPHFLWGDRRRPVHLMIWGADREAVEELNARGPFVELAPQPPEAQQSKAKSAWKDGQWKLVVLRPLTTGDKDDVQFEEGRLIPISFNVWDGSNGEHGLIMSLSPWYYVTLEAPTPVVAYLVSLLGAAGLGLVFFRLNRKYRSLQGGTREGGGHQRGSAPT